jgi:toxin YoeB
MPEPWDDYLRWDAIDSDITAKINELIKDIRRNPFRGIGKPEPLKGEFAGWWSRRITGEHRLVYCISGSGKDQQLVILSCRNHYK